MAAGDIEWSMTSRAHVAALSLFIPRGNATLDVIIHSMKHDVHELRSYKHRTVNVCLPILQAALNLAGSTHIIDEWKAIQDKMTMFPAAENITEVFYVGLVAIALTQNGRHEYRELAAECVGKMRGFAAAGCPWNFDHKVQLLSAEMKNLDGHLLELPKLMGKLSNRAESTDSGSTKR